MSDRARDVVRYIRVVEQIEDGERERWKTVYYWPGTYTFDGRWIPPMGSIQEDPDYARAQRLDISPNEQLAWALKYVREKYGPRVWA